MIQRQNGREDQSEGSLLSDRTLLSVSTFISFNWATRVRQSSCEAEVLQVFKTNSLNLLNTAFQYVTQQKIRTEIKGPHILFKAIKVHHISKKDLQDNLLTLCIQTDPRPTHWYKYRLNFFLMARLIFSRLMTGTYSAVSQYSTASSGESLSWHAHTAFSSEDYTVVHKHKCNTRCIHNQYIFCKK